MKKAANGIRCPAITVSTNIWTPESPPPRIGDDKKGPLFQSFKKGDGLTGNPMIRSDVLYMTKRRAKGAALPNSTAVILFARLVLRLIFRTAARLNTLSR